jgi:CubicO group peptidase (beta-lactamase class C family)
MYRALRLVVQVCLGLVVAGVSTDSWAEDKFPGDKWEMAASPDAVGWSSGRLRIADDFAGTIQTDAYLIVQHGLIVHEYGATARATNIHSIRKSILSILMGIHLDRGVVDIDKTLAELDIDDKETLSATERQATVRQLMQSRSGVYHPAAYETPKMAGLRPARGSFKPGEHWYYNNWDFNALGTIFQKFTGKTIFKSLCEDLAEPLQFENFNCSSDTRFQYECASMHPAYVIRLSARDMARVGLLMARNGRWKDRQIVPEKWVEESTRSYSETNIPGRGYGYLWWVNLRHKSYSANGFKGQIMIVNPVRDLILVHKVDSESDPGRKVSDEQLSELLRRIMDAQVPVD